MRKMISEQRLDDFLQAKTTPEETMEILEEMAFNPSLQEYVITAERMNHEMELQKDYGCFIPASRLAAESGGNLCDFQCETFILKKHGIPYKEDQLAEEARKNYWLSSQGTPLYNIGRLLEANGLLVDRVYDATLESLTEGVRTHDAIAVVCSRRLHGDEGELFDNGDPDHAVIVLAVDNAGKAVSLYDPSGNGDDTCSLGAFLKAWECSSNYLVLVRKRKYDEEFIPHPIDVSGVTLSPDLLRLTDTIAENAHNVWAEEKRRTTPGIRYAPLDPQGHEVAGCNHFFLPYSQLSEEDKKPDIDMALNTIKLLKRLGFRLVNMNELHQCTQCGAPIELHHLYCSHCGRKLSWEDFR